MNHSVWFPFIDEPFYTVCDNRIRSLSVYLFRLITCMLEWACPLCVSQGSLRWALLNVVSQAPSHDDCFDLCSEEIRPSVLDVTGWHITWIQANKRAEGKYQGNISGIHRELWEWNNDFALRGKSDHAGMFILVGKEAIIVITRDFLFHSTILTVDCILITIPSMNMAIVIDDKHFSLWHHTFC